MNTGKIGKLIAAIAIPLVVFSCGDSATDDSVNGSEDGPSNALNVVDVLEDITEATTWETGTVYLIKDHDFWVSATLTIEPGAVVMFTEEGRGLALSDAGLIKAVGTAEEPIYFTSYRDDVPAGDINGDGGDTEPLPGDWGSVDLGVDQNGSEFKYVVFSYSGHAQDYEAALHVMAGTVTVDNCTFHSNKGGPNGDFWYGALTVEGSSETSKVTNNTFYDNGLPLVIHPGMDLDNSNEFSMTVVSDSDTVVVENKYQGIYTYTLDEVSGHITWEETEVAIVIDDNDFWVNEEATLTLGDSVVLKFMPGSVLLLDDGESALVNHDGPGVTFTSFKDDSLKGDANGDEDGTSPEDGDWEGIYDNSALEEPYYFGWSNILYATN